MDNEQYEYYLTKIFGDNGGRDAAKEQFTRLNTRIKWVECLRPFKINRMVSEWVRFKADNIRAASGLIN